MAAAHYHLDNLIAVVDYNKVMAKGFTWDLMGIEPLADKWRSFGWDVLEVDGHSLAGLQDAFHQLRWVRPRGRPLVLIAHTVKGKGIDRAEFNYKWHTHAPDPETADQMLRALARAYRRPEEGYAAWGWSTARRPSMAGNDVAPELEMREAFGRALVELGQREPRIRVLDADLCTSTKASLFRDAYPGRFVQLGIAEQNLFGVAAGLALEGFIPFPCTFASFAARRGLDQIADLHLLRRAERQDPRIVPGPAHQPRRSLAQLPRGPGGHADAAGTAYRRPGRQC